MSRTSNLTVPRAAAEEPAAFGDCDFSRVRRRASGSMEVLSSGPAPGVCWRESSAPGAVEGVRLGGGWCDVLMVVGGAGAGKSGTAWIW